MVASTPTFNLFFCSNSFVNITCSVLIHSWLFIKFLATDQTAVSNDGMSTEYVKESVVAYFIFCNCFWRLKLTTTGLKQDSRYPCQVLNKSNIKRQFGLN